MVKAQDDDTPVLCFRGTCKSFGKYYAADETTDPPKQAMQIATFTEGKESITVKFFNRDAIPAAWKGKTVWIMANHNKNGWTGVKAKDNTYKDETERILLVTKSAEVGLNAPDESGGEAPQDDAPADTAPSVTKQAERAMAPKAATTAAATHDTHAAVARMRMELAKYANAFILVTRAADYVRTTLENSTTPIEVTDAQFQAMCSTFFIKADRQGLIDELPVKPIGTATAAKPASPAPKPEPPKVMPKPQPPPPPPQPEPPAESPVDNDDVPW